MFATQVTEKSTINLEGLGSVRVEVDALLGERVYKWVRNKSGGTLAIDSVAGWELRSEAAITAGANTDPKKIVRSAGTWVNGELNGFYVRVLDDAGAAGAAPEGESGRVLSNDTTTITLVDALTAPVTTSDTFEILRPWHIIASADAMVAQEVAGVLMVALLDGDYGWVQCRGFHPSVNCVAAGTTLAAAAAVKAAAGIVVVAADNADNGEIIGANVLQVTTDTVRRKAFVWLGLNP